MNGGSFGLPEIVAGLIVVALNAYLLMGGADFGGGVWDLLARGPRRAAQRRLIAGAIGPIWEANHVWLIVVIVLLFTAFPAVYATLSTVLHIPLVLVLLGIVLRGSAFVFRSYGPPGMRERWGGVFAVASTIAPVLLGVVLGALASGAVGEAAARLAGAAEGAPPAFAEVFVRPWWAPFPWAAGFMTLALVTFLAAVYLTVAATDPAVREDFRRRALMAGGAVFVTAAGALALARDQAPRVGAGLTFAPWAMPLHVATGAAAVLALWALWRRRWRTARVATAAQASLILWGWALAQYPVLIPPALTIRDAAAPRVTLALLAGTLAAGGLILVPSLVYLFRTFAAVRETTPPVHDGSG